SLLSGESHHSLLAGSSFVGPAETAAAYVLVDLGEYPALLEGGTTAVSGELYDVDVATLTRVDEFEGHPDLYRRTPVLLAGGGQAEAYVLAAKHLADAPRRPIAGGDWRACARSSPRIAHSRNARRRSVVFAQDAVGFAAAGVRRR
ncbi:MAG: gamma-glutamylcyclotransferase, partial [Myxococcales bacterium]|nr:gamma-glutamylcyclotransferase [Myxococcales bacterium]